MSAGGLAAAAARGSVKKSVSAAGEIWLAAVGCGKCAYLPVQARCCNVILEGARLNACAWVALLALPH